MVYLTVFIEQLQENVIWKWVKFHQNFSCKSAPMNMTSYVKEYIFFFHRQRAYLDNLSLSDYNLASLSPSLPLSLPVCPFLSRSLSDLFAAM